MNRSNGDSQKAFGGVMAILAVMATCVGALVATTRPMTQRIDHLERALETAVSNMDIDNARELSDAGKFSELASQAQASVERIAELDVKLQIEIAAAQDISDERIRALQEKIAVEIEAFQKLMDQITTDVRDRVKTLEDLEASDTGDDASQWERIRALERETFGKPGPSGPSSTPGG